MKLCSVNFAGFFLIGGGTHLTTGSPSTAYLTCRKQDTKRKKALIIKMYNTTKNPVKKRRQVPRFERGVPETPGTPSYLAMLMN